MPRDLFGHVTRPSMSVGTRKWYTVPVSLLSHSLLLALFVVLPILAAPLMPSVLANDNPDYIISILPPPPPPPSGSARQHQPVPDPNVAPTEAPTGFSKEPERPPDLAVSDTPGIVVGMDNIEHALVAPPAPPKPQPPAPVHVGGGVRPPVRTKAVDPVYPPVALAARIQGIVIIEATIGADGRIVNARVLRSVQLLDQAALDAVRQWEYTPTMLNGVPVPVIMTVTVQFNLAK